VRSRFFCPDVRPPAGPRRFRFQQVRPWKTALQWSEAGGAHGFDLIGLKTRAPAGFWIFWPPIGCSSPPLFGTVTPLPFGAFTEGRYPTPPDTSSASGSIRIATPPGTFLTK